MARRKRKLTKEQRARRERLKRVGVWSLVGLVTYEAYLAMVNRRQRRRDVFNAALNAQNATGKPLLVMRDPDGGVLNRTLGRDFDCGDLCIDPRGCPSCANVIVAQPEAGLEQLEDNSHVVYVPPGVIERSRYGEHLITQLHRVAGEDLFVAPLEAWSTLAWLPPTRRRVKSAPPTTPYVEWRDLPWQPGPSNVRRSTELMGVGAPRLRVFAGGRV